MHYVTYSNNKAKNNNFKNKKKLYTEIILRCTLWVEELKYEVEVDKFINDELGKVDKLKYEFHMFDRLMDISISYS